MILQAGEGYRYVMQILAAAMTPAPPPPTVYTEPPTELDVSITNLRYRQLINTQERLVKLVIEDLQQSRLASAGSYTQLQSENAALRAQVEQYRTAYAGAEARFQREKLKPASRSGLTRVLLVAIARAYHAELKQRKPKPSIATLLASDASLLLGMTIDPKTARKYGNEVQDLYRSLHPEGIP